MSGERPPLRTAWELLDLLVAPDASERLSPLGDGPGVLVLDLGAIEPPLDRESADRLTGGITTLACVSVALGGDPDEPIACRLRSCCDVTVTDLAELEVLLTGFRRTPIAALALVQLLRASLHHSIHDAIVSESFAYSTLQAGPEFQAWLADRRARAAPARRDVDAPCRIERDRGRLDIRLTRPHKHNALSRDLRDALVEAFQLVLGDPSIHEVVLSGEGPSFCSGGDLDEFGSFPDPATAHAIRTTRSPAALLARLARRVRAEVHGACVGAGVELPAFAGHVVASEDARFSLPEVGLGLVPGAGGTASLPRRIGRQRTAWLGLSGQAIDAPTALAWGLVDEVRLGHAGKPEVGRGVRARSADAG